MKVDITISGQVDIDPGDLEQLTRESVSTLGVVLQLAGKNVKVRVAEVYEKEPAKAGK
jgi:hypothetical protein